MLPKRHRRSIQIGQQQFFWHYTSGRELNHRSPQLIVQAASGGPLLIVRQASWPEVTPHFVVAIVQEAIAAGWATTEGKQPFTLSRESEGRLE